MVSYFQAAVKLATTVADFCTYPNTTPIPKQGADIHQAHPLCVMLCLAILSFKPKNTKIHFENHRIVHLESGYAQSASRTMLSRNAKDLGHLEQPIKQALLWYNSKNPSIHKIFSLAKKGLLRLMLTYENSRVNKIALNSLAERIEAKLNVTTDKQSHILLETKEILNSHTNPSSQSSEKMNDTDESQMQSSGQFKTNLECIVKSVFLKSKIKEWAIKLGSAEEKQGLQSPDTQVLCHEQLKELIKSLDDGQEMYANAIQKAMMVWT